MSEMGADEPALDAQNETGRVVAVRLRNACPESMWYSVEPWGEGYDLHPGHALTLLSDGPNSAYLEVVLEEAMVTTWSDTGTTHTVLDGETDLGPGLGWGPPVPSYPPGFGRPTLPLAPAGVYRVELLCKNKGAHPLVLRVPTQSEQYTLLPGATCAVVAAGRHGGTLELELAENAVTVNGWPAAQIAIVGEGGWSVTS